MQQDKQSRDQRQRFYWAEPFKGVGRGGVVLLEMMCASHRSLDALTLWDEWECVGALIPEKRDCNHLYF